jgi:hypothetical protein
MESYHALIALIEAVEKLLAHDDAVSLIDEIVCGEEVRSEKTSELFIRLRDELAKAKTAQKTDWGEL